MSGILLDKYKARHGDLISLSGDIFINEKKTVKYTLVTGDVISVAIVNPYDQTYIEYKTNNISNFTVSANQYISQYPYTYHIQVVVRGTDNNIKFTTDPEVFEVV